MWITSWRIARRLSMMKAYFLQNMVGSLEIEIKKMRQGSSLGVTWKLICTRNHKISFIFIIILNTFFRREWISVKFWSQLHQKDISLIVPRNCTCLPCPFSRNCPFTTARSSECFVCSFCRIQLYIQSNWGKRARG